MIASVVDEWDRKQWRALVSGGYDPYNSADRPWALQLLDYKKRVQKACTPTPAELIAAEIDYRARRGFKYLADHPQLAANNLAWSLEFNRMMNARTAKQFDQDTFITSAFALAQNRNQKPPI